MDIQGLVAQQGDLIDNIFLNVERAGIDVEQGKEQLDKAKKLMERNRKMKIIACIVLAIVVLIILLVILIEFNAFSSSPSSSQNTVTIIKEIHHYYNETNPTSENPTSTESLPKQETTSHAIVVTDEPLIVLPDS